MDILFSALFLLVDIGSLTLLVKQLLVSQQWYTWFIFMFILICTCLQTANFGANLVFYKLKQLKIVGEKDGVISKTEENKK